MLKIVYLGTPEFAVKPFVELLRHKDKFEVCAAVTNPDRPVGRKQIMTPSPVKQAAINNGIRVFTYDKIKLEGVNDMKELSPDLMVTCAFGQILSREILDIPRLGVINVHASLLPKYRGASPIHYAVLNGEKQTGITIMKTDIGIDTGDIILQKSIDIGERETCGELFERLSVLGAKCLIDALELMECGKAVYRKQDDSAATLTKMIRKEDALIDWNKSAAEVFNAIRAFNPAPSAFTFLDGLPLKIFEAEINCGAGLPGEIICCDENKLEIACGKGSVVIKKLQKSGGKEMTAQDFLRGNKLVKGSFLGK